MTDPGSSPCGKLDVPYDLNVPCPLTQDPALASWAAAVAVNDAGVAVAVAPADGGSWLVSVDPTGAARVNKRFVAGRYLRYPMVFPDGRLAVEDTGAKDEDFPQTSLLVDPGTGEVVWSAMFPGHHTFSHGGKVAAWMPCYDCGTERGNDPVTVTARQYLDRGLTLALESTVEPGSARTVSFDGEGFRWSNVGEVVGTGVWPLDEAGTSALVVWGGALYRVDGEAIRPLPVPDDVGPVREARVSPDGGTVAVALDLGEWAGFDTNTGARRWTTRVGASPLAEFAARQLGAALPEGPYDLFAQPTGPTEVVFVLSTGAVVAYSFAVGDVKARLDAAPDGGTYAPWDAAPAVAVSPKGRYVAILDRTAGRLTVRSLLASAR